MDIVWIVLAFAAGITCGLLYMYVVYAQKREVLKRREEELEARREKLEQKYDFDFPEPPEDQKYFYQKIF